MEAEEAVEREREIPSPRQLLRERLRLEHNALVALKAKVDELRGKLPMEFKATDFSKLARAYTLEALAVLKEGLAAPSWPTRLEAAKVLLAYAWGKPKEMPEVHEAVRPLAGMSTEELTITLRRTLAQYEPERGEVTVVEASGVRAQDGAVRVVGRQGDAAASDGASDV